MDAIAHLTRAKADLAAATTIQEVKQIRDKAEALRTYQRQAGLGLEAQNLCAEIKLRAERRAGELLSETPRAERGRPVKTLHAATILPRLKDLGIERTEAHRWQAIASVSETRLERHIAQTKAANRELTSAGVLAIAKTERKRGKHERTKAMPDTVANLSRLIDDGAKFSCIYADPPWQYGNQSTRSATDNEYGTMPIGSICALPISQLASPSSHLHIWTTSSFLRETFAVIDAWGFEYKSSFVWTKPQFGIGNYWRLSHEFLLTAIRGKCPFLSHDVKSWITHDRLEHSQKPEAIRKLIERVSPSPRLELFARRSCEGWTVWGNEVDAGILPFRKKDAS